MKGLVLLILHMKEEKITKKIYVEERVEYLKEIMLDLPVGLFNKKITGCGATSLVLENNRDVIVVCPNIALIESKVNQYPNAECPYEVFGVFGRIKDNDIDEYISKCEKMKQPKKIMVTYNSISKVMKTIGDVSSYKIVVDEFHEILLSGGFRNETIKNLLMKLSGHVDVTYISATPIPVGYLPPELEKLDSYEVVWAKNRKKHIFDCATGSPIKEIAKIIKNHKAGNPYKLLGNEVSEYIVIANSVEMIAKIISESGLRKREVKIICANKKENKKKLNGYEINKASDKKKGIVTFCTRTAFCGVDFYTESGLIVIVSDRLKGSTLLDVSIDVVQISGRIRTIDNPFKDTVLHIHSKNIKCEPDEAFEKKLEIAQKNAEEIVCAINKAEVELKEALIDRIDNNNPEDLVYYNKETGKAELDQLKISAIKYNQSIRAHIYKNRGCLKQSYVENGFELHEIKGTFFGGVKNKSFKKLYIEYSNACKNNSTIKNDDRLVLDAYKYLGDNKVKALRYNKAKIEDEVYYHLPETQDKIKCEIYKTFNIGNIYTIRDTKLKLQDCFNHLRIKIIATSEMIKDYFDVTKTKEKGSRKDAYKINAIKQGADSDSISEEKVSYLFVCFSGLYRKTELCKKNRILFKCRRALSIR